MKKDLVASSTGNLPEWTNKNPVKYFEAADLHERNNGRIYREIEAALPKELNKEQNIALIKEFAHIVTKRNLPFMWGFHGNPGNPHFHLLVSERMNDGVERTDKTWFKRANSINPAQGGAKKTNEMEPQKWLYNLRENWGIVCNKHLKGSVSISGVRRQEAMRP